MDSTAPSEDQIHSAAVAMGRRGGTKVREKMLAADPDYYKKIGKKGGNATKAAHGHSFYESIGAKGGAKRHKTAKAQ